MTTYPTRLVETENASAHLLLALLPTTGMAAIALYIAVYMWKYGNDASIVVQSTVCNGWIFLFLGTLALLAGQVPPEVSVGDHFSCGAARRRQIEREKEKGVSAASAYVLVMCVCLPL